MLSAARCPNSRTQKFGVFQGCLEAAVSRDVDQLNLIGNTTNDYIDSGQLLRVQICHGPPKLLCKQRLTGTEASWSQITKSATVVFLLFLRASLLRFLHSLIITQLWRLFAVVILTSSPLEHFSS